MSFFADVDSLVRRRTSSKFMRGVAQPCPQNQSPAIFLRAHSGTITQPLFSRLHFFHFFHPLCSSPTRHQKPRKMTTQGNLAIHDIKHTEDTVLGKGRWLSLHQVQFQDPSGTPRGWEVCRRIKPVSATNPASNNGDILGNTASVDGEKQGRNWEQDAVNNTSY